MKQDSSMFVERDSSPQELVSFQGKLDDLHGASSTLWAGSIRHGLQSHDTFSIFFLMEHFFYFVFYYFARLQNTFLKDTVLVTF